MISLTPGDPVDIMLADQRATPEQAAAHGGPCPDCVLPAAA